MQAAQQGVAPEFIFVLRKHRWGGDRKNALSDFKRLTGLSLNSAGSTVHIVAFGANARAR
jgi:hypothetical protein